MSAPPPGIDSSTWALENSEILPLMPLVYVVWSDGVLTPEELEAICSRLDSANWMSRESIETVRSWLDPALPPPAWALQQLRDRIRRTCGDDVDGCPSLAAVGLKFLNPSHQEGWAGPAGVALLGEMEAALGVVGAEAARELLSSQVEEIETATELDTTVPFDPTTLRRHLEAGYLDLRDELFSLLARPDFDFPLELLKSEYRERVLQAVQVLADEGYGRLAFPAEYGGAEDPGRAIVAFETLAYGDTSVLVKFGVQFGLWGGSVFQLGTACHHRAYLEAIGRLDLPGCYAMTELGHGSNVRDVETTATYDPGTEEFVIHTPSDAATKWWIGNAALHGRMATVFAQLHVAGEEYGVHSLLVPLRNTRGDVLQGVHIEDCGVKEGLNGIDNGTIRFDHVRVPRTHLLDRFAEVTAEGEYRSEIPSSGRRFFTMLGTLVAGRVSIAAASVSSAKVGLTIAVRYTAGRHQFGPAGGAEVPILDYLVQQRQLLPKLATTYGLHFACRNLTRRYAEGQAKSENDDEAKRELEVLAAGLKAYASTHNVQTLQACREACGGQGYLADNRFGRLMADTDVFTTFEGANAVLLQLVAKGLLSRYQHEMGDLKLWGILKHLADRAGTQVSELNPVAVRRTEPEHLLGSEFHRAAFQYREERLLASAARRLKGLIDDGMDSFDAMNQCQDHLVTLANAYVENRILESFLTGVKGAEDRPTGSALATLAQLYALATMEKHSGWYQEAGYMEGVKTRAIRAQVNELVGEVRGMALPLVEAFGISNGVLKAPAGVL